MRALAGIEPARKPHGAKRPGEVFQAGAVEFVPQEAVVEARVVRDEHAPGEAFVQFGGDVGEARRAFHHLLGDAGERLDRSRDRTPGIDQRGPLRGEGETADFKNGNLRDSIARRIRAGSFDVDDGERAVHGRLYSSALWRRAAV